jgi:hypothetical protein
MKRLALLIGVLMVCLGVTGLAMPVLLFEAARAAQWPPLLYVAAAVRIVIGIVLFLAAPRSRASTALSVVAVIIFTSGLLTPFLGASAAQLILDSWNAFGAITVRAFATFAIAVGALIIYAVAPSPSAKKR